MDDQDIDILIKNGFYVPDYLKEDKYLLVKEDNFKDTFFKCVELSIDGKKPVVMVLDKVIRDKKSTMVENTNYYKMLKAFDRKIGISIFEHEICFFCSETVDECRCSSPMSENTLKSDRTPEINEKSRGKG